MLLLQAGGQEEKGKRADPPLVPPPPVVLLSPLSFLFSYVLILLLPTHRLRGWVGEWRVKKEVPLGRA